MREREYARSIGPARCALRPQSTIRPRSHMHPSAFYQELHDSDFGKREEIHKIKRAKRAADVQAHHAAAAAHAAGSQL